MKRPSYNPVFRMVFVMMMFLLLALCLGATQKVFAQSSIQQETIDLTWSLDGLDPDTQAFRLYMHSSPDFSQAVQLGEDLPYNPNDPTAAETFQWPSMNIDVPAGEDVTRYFWVTAVDTSGNECHPGFQHQVCTDNPPDMVEVRFDRLPPVPPSGLTVTARVVVNTVTQ